MISGAFYSFYRSIFPSVVIFFCLRTTFSSSYIAVWLAMHSFKSWCLKNYLFCLWLWKISSEDTNPRLIVFFFLSVALIMLIHCLLTCIISNKKSTDLICCISVHNIFILWLLLIFFSLLLILINLIMVWFPPCFFYLRFVEILEYLGL